MYMPVQFKAYLMVFRSVVRRLVMVAATLSLLADCESLNQTAALLSATPGGSAGTPDASGTADAPSASDAVKAGPSHDASPDMTASIAPSPSPVSEPAPPPDAEAVIPDPYDDLSIGKRQFRAGNFGLAERYFRRAAEKAPGDANRDAEAWLGLAATYDRLRRFELADRGYVQVLKILGPTAEVLNNQGYSYLLRGDYRRARVKLAAARDLDPTNPYVLNNLDILDRSVRGKAMQ
jgi:tetratricopeptide (TPR) repeat protein